MYIHTYYLVHKYKLQLPCFWSLKSACLLPQISSVHRYPVPVIPHVRRAHISEFRMENQWICPGPVKYIFDII